MSIFMGIKILSINKTLTKKFFSIFIVVTTSTLYSFAQINNGNSTSINMISNTNENIYWEQVFHNDSSYVLPFNQADFDAYKNIIRNIKTINLM